MKQRFIEEVKKSGLISRGERVIVALSGGADSMTLLHLLAEARDEIGFSLCAAHVNHCLRGDESERDESFVRGVCKEMNVELHVLRADIKHLATQKNLGLEECGRIVRYEFFESVDKNAKIATAHTLSDNLETVLLNLTRGSVLNGLCGIPQIRGNIIRPLLKFTRAEIESYCEENAIEYVTDSSNFSDEYNRNKIRNSVIPLLKGINPSVETGLCRCIDSLNEDENYLQSAAAELSKEARLQSDDGIEAYDAAKIKSAPACIRKRALRLIASGRTNGKPQNHHIALLEKLLQNGEAIQLSGSFCARIRKGRLEIVGITSPKDKDAKSSGNVKSFGNVKDSDRGEKSSDSTDKDEESSDSADKGEERLAERREAPFIKDGCDREFNFYSALIRTQIINKTDFDYQQKVYKTGLESCLDYDKICTGAFFRTRRDGDRIRQCSGKCTKTLKKLFNERGIPPESRDGIIILSDDSGIAWLEGYGCDAHCAIDDKTERILKIYVQR